MVVETGGAVPQADGRTRLLDTAERLLDQHGIDGVSLRAVTLAAGHRNASAVNYHFGNREQLVAAVLERRRAGLEESRQARLDALEANGPVAPLDALRAAVEPLSDLLEELTGRRYLRLLFQAVHHPAFYGRAVDTYSPSIARTGVHLLPLVAHLPPERRMPRLRLGMNLALLALANQARLLDTDPPPHPVLDRTTFTGDLVEIIVGALTA
jgi:AcrR family transcriptional regulator